MCRERWTHSLMSNVLDRCADLFGQRAQLGLISVVRLPQTHSVIAFPARDEVDMIMKYGLPSSRAVVLDDIDAIGLERRAQAARHALHRPRYSRQRLRRHLIYIGVRILADHQAMPA